jgi:lipopolysaccharide transport protein LptA
MGISFPKLLLAAAAMELLTGVSGTIKVDPSKPPINYSGDTLDYDYKTHLMHLRGNVKISSGDTSIAADEAQVTGQDPKNYRWVFTGKVHVRSESQGDVRGDRATVEITQGELANALVTGSPAQFEQTRSNTDRLVMGHATTVDYDVAAGTVTLTGDALLTDDRNENEMSSPSITYNVRDRRIESDAGATVGGRVHMRILPKASPGTASGSAPSAEHAKP